MDKGPLICDNVHERWVRGADGLIGAKGSCVGGRGPWKLLGTEPRSHSYGAGGRSPSKGIRLSKVKVSAAKLLAMAQIAGWMRVWKSTKCNSNLFILNIIPGPTPAPGTETTVKYGPRDRVCAALRFSTGPETTAPAAAGPPPSGSHGCVAKVGCAPHGGDSLGTHGGPHAGRSGDEPTPVQAAGVPVRHGFWSATATSSCHPTAQTRSPSLETANQPK